MEANRGGDGYRGPQVCSIVGITYRQLDYWARTELLRPSITEARGSGTQRRYSYSDLLELKVIKRLLDAGHLAAAARRAIECLRSSGEEVASANLVINGGRTVLAHSGEEIIDLLRGWPGCAQHRAAGGGGVRARGRHPRISPSGRAGPVPPRRSPPGTPAALPVARSTAVPNRDGRVGGAAPHCRPVPGSVATDRPVRRRTAGCHHPDAASASVPVRERERRCRVRWRPLQLGGPTGSPTTRSASSPSCSTSTAWPGSTSRPTFVARVGPAGTPVQRLQPRLLPPGVRRLHRDHHAQPAAGDQEEPQGAAAAPAAP